MSNSAERTQATQDPQDNHDHHTRKGGCPQTCASCVKAATVRVGKRPLHTADHTVEGGIVRWGTVDNR